MSVPSFSPTAHSFGWQTHAGLDILEACWSIHSIHLVRGSSAFTQSTLVVFRKTDSIQMQSLFSCKSGIRQITLWHCASVNGSVTKGSAAACCHHVMESIVWGYLREDSRHLQGQELKRLKTPKCVSWSGTIQIFNYNQNYKWQLLDGNNFQPASNGIFAGPG